jgi:Flp pilus assembly protein TadB
MDEVLEIVALVAGVVAGFLVAPAVGFAAIAAGCLWVSWRRARGKRLVLEAEMRRQLERDRR